MLSSSSIISLAVSFAIFMAFIILYSPVAANASAHWSCSSTVSLETNPFGVNFCTVRDNPGQIVTYELHCDVVHKNEKTGQYEISTNPREVAECIMLGGPKGAKFSSTLGKPGIGNFQFQVPEGTEGGAAYFTLKSPYVFFDATTKGRLEITPNQPPKADAGNDKVEDQDTTVTLDGTKSIDPEDGTNIKKYHWEIVPGPDSNLISLNNPDTAKPSFKTPKFEKKEDYRQYKFKFKLEVTDQDDLKSKEPAFVTIKCPCQDEGKPSENEKKIADDTEKFFKQIIGQAGSMGLIEGPDRLQHWLDGKKSSDDDGYKPFVNLEWLTSAQVIKNAVDKNKIRIESTGQSETKNVQNPTSIKNIVTNTCLSSMTFGGPDAHWAAGFEYNQPNLALHPIDTADVLVAIGRTSLHTQGNFVINCIAHQNTYPFIAYHVEGDVTNDFYDVFDFNPNGNKCGPLPTFSYICVPALFGATPPSDAIIIPLGSIARVPLAYIALLPAKDINLVKKCNGASDFVQDAHWEEHVVFDGTSDDMLNPDNWHWTLVGQ